MSKTWVRRARKDYLKHRKNRWEELLNSRDFWVVWIAEPHTGWWKPHQCEARDCKIVWGSSVKQVNILQLTSHHRLLLLLTKTRITPIISHYLFGELRQCCQCITATNQGITYHGCTRLYLSSYTVALCSALISSDDKENYSDFQLTLTLALKRTISYNPVN